ncbi:MAG: glycosyltransferase family 2 protein [Bacteroidales bacterium]|nr:glycosyltransferase family 2 protein [Bacteroidales bacterium]MDD2424769.1 glycosyltransferase family 2 protein [Bacteroidales bacterium]MDD3988663.1 glycosyltransferase family 2 protein [Bacteroidales bacterium]MDD4638985.1 glycosyltransferase family 2 protein [Bacteroidales bacterium]
MDLSIVISLFNEEESLPELLSRIKSTLGDNYKYEIILVDDGSTDSSWRVILRQKELYPDTVKAIRFMRNYGKSAAIYCGFEAAQGNIVITMDADLQDNPGEIPELYKMISSGEWDLVSGWKKKRKDNVLTKNIPSRIYNYAARLVTGVRLHDMNCGLKAYRKEVIKNIEVYGEMHRYIPYIAKNAGFLRIGEKVVAHQSRKYGKSKFGMDRFFKGFLDLLSIWFLSRFGKRPMHFFGLIGTMTFLIGTGTSVWLIAEKIASQAKGLPYRAVTDQPLFYISLVALIIGMQLFLSGFIGEMISRNSSERNNYKIRERIS